MNIIFEILNRRFDSQSLRKLRTQSQSLGIEEPRKANTYKPVTNLSSTNSDSHVSRKRRKRERELGGHTCVEVVLDCAFPRAAMASFPPPQISNRSRESQYGGEIRVLGVEERRGD